MQLVMGKLDPVRGTMTLQEYIAMEREIALEEEQERKEAEEDALAIKEGREPVNRKAAKKGEKRQEPAETPVVPTLSSVSSQSILLVDRSSTPSPSRTSQSQQASIPH
mgnify:CR=1 FL=1